MMRASLCRNLARTPVYASRQHTKSRCWPTTPWSNLNTVFAAENTALYTRRRNASSKFPVYFSQENNASQQPRIPSTRSNPPVYFSNPTGPAPLPVPPPQSQSQSQSQLLKRSKWALAIAFGSLSCSLYGFYKLSRMTLSNREEVPFVDRIRYNLLPEGVFLAETSATVIATRTGYPTLDSILDSDLVVKPGEGQEVVDLTHQVFDKLLADNGLSGIQLHILYEPNLRHAENQFSRDHVIIYSGILESCNTEALIAAHLAPVIASTVLHHREEAMSWTMMITEHLVPNALLLLPITIVYKLSAIVTVPIMATVAGVWYARHTIDEYLDDEADGLALDFLHNAGYDVMDYLQYRVLEAQIQDQLLAKYVVDGQVSMAKAPTHQMARDVQRAQKFMLRQENVLEHLEERYQERLIRAEQEGQLVQQKPGSKPRDK